MTRLSSQTTRPSYTLRSEPSNEEGKEDDDNSTRRPPLREIQHPTRSIAITPASKDSSFTNPQATQLPSIFPTNQLKRKTYAGRRRTIQINEHNKSADQPLKAKRARTSQTHTVNQTATVTDFVFDGDDLSSSLGPSPKLRPSFESPDHLRKKKPTTGDLPQQLAQPRTNTADEVGEHEPDNEIIEVDTAAEGQDVEIPESDNGFPTLHGVEEGTFEYDIAEAQNTPDHVAYQIQPHLEADWKKLSITDQVEFHEDEEHPIQTLRIRQHDIIDVIYKAKPKRAAPGKVIEIRMRESNVWLVIQWLWTKKDVEMMFRPSETAAVLQKRMAQWPRRKRWILSNDFAVITPGLIVRQSPRLTSRNIDDSVYFDVRSKEIRGKTFRSLKELAMKLKMQLSQDR